MRKNVLIIGGDQRYLEVIRILTEQELNVFLVGFDQLSFALPNVTKLRLDEVDFEKIDVVLLAIGGTDDHGRIASDFSEAELVLTEEMIAQTPKHALICTGVLNDYLVGICRERTLIDLYARDDVAIYNSIPTAEGILQTAMQETDYTIHGANVLVLGFGRVGATVAHLFHAVGANVTVAVRKRADMARIEQQKLHALPLTNLTTAVSEMDIVINTIPHRYVNAALLAKLQQHVLIIDIATKPGGVDFAAAEKLGIKALHLLGIPGKVAPKTGGKIMAHALLEVMK